MDTDQTFDPKKYTVDKSGHLRFDYLFSYWIYAWFIIYYFVDTTGGSKISAFVKRWLNPKFALYIALLENMATLPVIIYYSVGIAIVLKYISMMFIVKIFPILLLRKDPIKWPADVFTFFVIFGIYNIYLSMNDESFIGIYKRTITAFMTNDELALPGIRFVHNTFGI